MKAYVLLHVKTKNHCQSLALQVKLGFQQPITRSRINVYFCTNAYIFSTSDTVDVYSLAHSNFCANKITFNVHKQSFMDFKYYFI